MDALSHSASAQRVLWPRAALLGGALGVIGVTGSSLVLYDAAGLLTGATGVIATLLASLLVGLWAGAPTEGSVPQPRSRWGGAGVTTAVAGAFATYWTLSGGVEGTLLGRVLGVLILLSVPVYSLGMLLPALLLWSDRWEDDEPEDEIPEHGWGRLGALGLGLLGGLIVGVLAAGLLLVPRINPGSLLLLTSVLLLLPVALPEPSPPETNERLIFEEDTPFGSLRVTEVVFPGERQPERRLYLDDEQESGELVRSGAPTLAYVAAAESWLSSTTPAESAYLFLGGGAYTLPRRIAERDSKARITVVELDPEVTRVAYRFFGLRREHGIRSVHGDARAFLERGAPGEFDRVHVDVYSGHESLPYSLVTVEACTAMARCLRPGGTLAVNLIGVTVGPEARRLWSVVRTVQEVFPAVALYWHLGPDYPDRQNLLLVAARDPEHEFPPQAGLFGRWPPEDWPASWKGTTVFHDLAPQGPGSGDVPAGSQERNAPARSP